MRKRQEEPEISFSQIFLSLLEYLGKNSLLFKGLFLVFGLIGAIIKGLDGDWSGALQIFLVIFLTGFILVTVLKWLVK